MKQLTTAARAHIDQNKRAPVVLGTLQSTVQGIIRSNTSKKINQPSHHLRPFLIIFTPEYLNSVIRLYYNYNYAASKLNKLRRGNPFAVFRDDSQDKFSLLFYLFSNNAIFSHPHCCP